MSNEITQSYVGDGVYTEFFTDGSFRLWTERFNGVHEIFFEPEMLDNLVKLRDAAHGLMRQGQEEER